MSSMSGDKCFVMDQTFENSYNLLKAGKMAKDVTPGCPGVGGKRKAAVGDGEVGGVLVEVHISACHPGRRLFEGK